MPLANPSKTYPPYSLRDPEQRRALARRLRERGVRISLGEGPLIVPGRDVRDLFGDIEILAELGAPRIGTIAVDPDLSRSIDQVGLLAEHVASLGLETVLETCPGLAMPDLPTGLKVLEQVGRPDLRLVLDAMHVLRAGATPADVAALDPALVGYIQLCDVPLVPRQPDYGVEALLDRLAPGDGELPLLDFLAAVPDGLVVGLEIPFGAHPELDVRAHLTHAVANSRDLLRRAAAVRAAA